MKNFQIFKYIRKLIPLIVVFCLLATYVIHNRLSASNTFVASEVIHYNDLQAEQGLATRPTARVHRGERKDSGAAGYTHAAHST